MSVRGGGGNDQIDGGDGDDNLRGESGDDTINGGDGDDFIRGGSGDDVINGGDGDDNLGGGSGNDTIVVTIGTGFDFVDGFDAGASVGDVIDLSALGFADFTAVLDATTDQGSDTVIDLDGDLLTSTDEIKLAGVQKADLNANDFLL